jgi:hypothetical protein
MTRAPSTIGAPPSAAQVQIIERYDSDGNWRPVPRTITVSAERAERLERLFPELDAKEVRPLATTELMRFEIRLHRANGKDATLYIYPDMTKWFDERSVYPLSAAASAEVLRVAADASEDQTLLIKQRSPVVQVQIVDLEDGYGNRRPVPLKAVVTGKEAELLASTIPEIGLHRPPQGSDLGSHRIEVTFIRANSEWYQVFVSEGSPGKWTWKNGATGTEHWRLSSRAWWSLISYLREANLREIIAK